MRPYTGNSDPTGKRGCTDNHPIRDQTMSIPNILTFASEKGGVLKTTLAIHAAKFSLDNNQKTILFDADPQMTAAMFFQEHANLGDIIELNDIFEENIHTEFNYLDADKIHVIRCDPNAKTSIEKWTSLKQAVQTMRFIAKIQGCDTLIIDTPASNNDYTLSTLMFSDAVVVPSLMDEASWPGVTAILANINIIIDNYEPRIRALKHESKRRVPLPKLIAVIPTAVKMGYRPQQAAMAEFQQAVNELTGEETLNTNYIIRNRARMQELYRTHKTIWEDTSGDPRPARHEMSEAMHLLFTRLVAANLEEGRTA